VEVDGEEGVASLVKRALLRSFCATSVLETCFTALERRGVAVWAKAKLAQRAKLRTINVFFIVLFVFVN